jgi:hypothetical protein
MLLKKLTLIASAMTLLSMPLIASANLDTNNLTDEASAVKVTNNPYPVLQICSGSPLINKFTPPRGATSVEFKDVKKICGKSSGICEADIFMSKDCSTRPVAHAAINLDNGSIVYVTPLDFATYEIKTVGSSGIDLCYKGQCATPF